MLQFPTDDIEKSMFKNKLSMLVICLWPINFIAFEKVFFLMCGIKDLEMEIFEDNEIKTSFISPSGIFIRDPGLQHSLVKIS